MEAQVKKIGILTLYHKNYNMGGLLQAYALQKVISKIGHQAEQISFDFLWYYGSSQSKIRIIIKKLHNYLDSSEKIDEKSPFAMRKQSFYQFKNEIPHSKKIYYTIEEFAKEYDAVVVGSDQVWAEWLPAGALNVYLLNSPAMDGKRFSYAASIGMDQISELMKKEYMKSLPKFENISLRENSAKVMMESFLTEKDISVNLDPTLLLEADEWKECMVEKKYKRPYIFCYFLGKEPLYREETKKLAKRVGLDIITLPFAKDHVIEDYEKDFGDVKDFASGPREFLGLIHNAEVVLTDSFHATVFSCIFHKKFYVLSRVCEQIDSMNQRITDLLGGFGFIDRYMEIGKLSSLFEIEEIDYSNFDGKLRELRDASTNYLIQILSN